MYISLSVWVRNFVSQTEEEHTLRVFWEKGAEENIWNKKGGSGRRLEKTA
jgi:hypothetical protein